MDEPTGRVAGLAGQVFTYLLVGGSAFVLDFGLLFILKSGLGAPAWFAAIMAFAVSTVWSFYLQRRYTFSGDLHVGHSAFRYGVLLATNMVITAGIVEGFDRSADKKMLLETFGSDRIVVSACGIAGMDLERITSRQLGHCTVFGDFATDCHAAPLYAHKVVKIGRAHV